MINKIYIDKLGNTPNITYVDENGYMRYEDTDKLLHRDIAYRYIYSANRKKYPLRFREYQVHHKDNEKQNNVWTNLEIVTEKQHEEIQGYKFEQNKEEIKYYPTEKFDSEKYKEEITYTAHKSGSNNWLRNIIYILGFIFLIILMSSSIR